MDTASNLITWIGAAMAVIAGSGLVAAVRVAIKEITEAWKAGKEAYLAAKHIPEKIALYKKDGLTQEEINDLMNDVEAFFKEMGDAIKEGEEAINASKNVWTIIKGLRFRKKR